jgi:hypothetical protein
VLAQRPDVLAGLALDDGRRAVARAYHAKQQVARLNPCVSEHPSLLLRVDHHLTRVLSEALEHEAILTAQPAGWAIRGQRVHAGLPPVALAIAPTDVPPPLTFEAVA